MKKTVKKKPALKARGIKKKVKPGSNAVTRALNQKPHAKYVELPPAVKLKKEKGKILLARVYDDNPECNKFCEQRRVDWRQNLNGNARIFHKTVRADGAQIPVLVFLVRQRLKPRKRKVT